MLENLRKKFCEKTAIIKKISSRKITVEIWDSRREHFNLKNIMNSSNRMIGRAKE